MTSSDDFDTENASASVTAIGEARSVGQKDKTEADKGLLPAGLSDLLAPQAQARCRCGRGGFILFFSIWISAYQAAITGI